MKTTSIQARSSAAHREAQVFQWSFLLPKYWLLWLWFAFLWLVTRLPYGVVKRVGGGLGCCLFYLLPKRRSIALQNLSLCFPDWSDARRWQVARAHFAGAGLTLFESGLVWWSRRSRFEGFFTLEGGEVLEQLAGRPVLFFGLHNTCVEMVYAYLSLQRPVNVLFRVNNNALWEYMATRSRERYQARLIPRKQVPEFIERLSRGEAGLLAADQDLGRKRSLFVPFFGVPTATVPSVHQFARQTGAAVVFAEAYRGGANGYVLRLHHLKGFPTEDAEADTGRMNAEIERSVQQHPEQYLWVHKRFKTRPEGAAPIYPPKRRRQS